MNSLTAYNKFYVAVAGAAIQLLTAFVPHNSAATLVIAVLTALGVYVTPNQP